MNIIPLSEGVFTVGPDKRFQPFDETADDLLARPRGSLLVEVQPFLIKLDHALLLLDCGLGFSPGGGMQLHTNIRKAGFSPGDVTHVLMSHLHKDHAGGVFQEHDNGLLTPSLPNAQYYIHRQEADYALSQGLPSFIPAELEPLLHSNQVRWLDGESGTIDPGISWQHSGGHSPWHITFLIEEHGKKVFYGGDEAPQLKQLLVRYVAKYDHDGKRAANLRQEYAAQGRREGWTFLFYHDVRQPTAVLKPE